MSNSLSKLDANGTYWLSLFFMMTVGMLVLFLSVQVWDTARTKTMLESGHCRVWSAEAGETVWEKCK